MAAITSAAAAAIAAAFPGESKENTLHNKINALKTICDHTNKGFLEAVDTVVYMYTIHPGTSSLTEEQVLDKMFLLPIDLLQWRWKKQLEKLFPWWEFTHNTVGHYTIEPAEYICPKERWEICKTTLRQPTFHTMYNLPNNSDKITYWDVFEQFSRKSTPEVASEMKKQHIHPEMKNFIIQRGCPKDLEEFVFCWAEDDRELMMHWQKWGQRGIEDHICKVTVKTTGIALEKLKKNPPKLTRQATWFGKFYPMSNACYPRERVELEGDDIPIVVEVVAPHQLHEMCLLEESGPKKNPTWKSKGVPAGKHWMIDIIWANLSHVERENISYMLETYDIPNNYTVEVDTWLNIQLLHNWGDCFTDESKKNLSWMLTPRKATW